MNDPLTAGRGTRAEDSESNELELSVVIVSYNTAELLAGCLESLGGALQSISSEVIVVDNASADGSADLVRERFPGVHLIESSENLGFARAVNAAGTQAAGAYLLLLNPDTRVLDAAIDELLSFARLHPAHGLYGGRTVDSQGAVDPRSCWGMPTPWSLFCYAAGLSSAFSRSRVFNPEALGSWQRDSVREVGALSGSFLLIHRNLWRRLRGFDPVYFMYSEDIDLSLRATCLGARPVFVPTATILHYVGEASPSLPHKMCLVMQGKATFISRNWNGPRRRWGLAMLWLGAFSRRALSPLLPPEKRATWAQVWRRRGAWLGGYGTPR